MAAPKPLTTPYLNTRNNLNRRDQFLGGRRFKVTGTFSNPDIIDVDGIFLEIAEPGEESMVLATTPQGAVLFIDDDEL